MRIVSANRALVQLGDRFQRLVVIGQTFFTASFDQDRSRWHRRQTVVCQCDCGSVSAVLVNQLRRSKTKSCGCLNLDVLVAGDRSRHGTKSPMYKHGGASGEVSRIYRIWTGMRFRCERHSPKNHRYAGRGIVVCEEWRDFKAFESWAMTSGYRDDLSIDRMNNDGNYEPSNCRWATAWEQAQNRAPKSISVK